VPVVSGVPVDDTTVESGTVVVGVVAVSGAVEEDASVGNNVLVVVGAVDGVVVATSTHAIIPTVT
jgi:hypothetical protein